MTNASYQTAPLSDYRDPLRARAESVFSKVKKLALGKAVLRDGSYSVLSRRGVVAGKIVLYQHGLGHENGLLPFRNDGVYILVRADGKAGRVIWKSGIVKTLGFAERLNPASTVGIAPRHSLRFAYFEIGDEDNHDRLAELLVKCANS